MNIEHTDNLPRILRLNQKLRFVLIRNVIFMNEFEQMVWEKCKRKDFEEHEYVVKQLIAFSQDVESISKRRLHKKKVIKGVLKNLDKVSFTLKYIPKYLKKSEGGIYYWIDGIKGIEVVDPEREYSLLHEFVHNLAVNGRNHGIRMKGKYDRNFSLDDGMAEYITRLLWKHRYPNGKPINRFEVEVGFAVKIFGLLGEERSIVIYLTKAKKLISNIKKLSSERYDCEREWYVLNENLDKLRTTRRELRGKYINKAEEAIRMLYLAKHEYLNKKRILESKDIIQKLHNVTDIRNNQKGLFLLHKILSSIKIREIIRDKKTNDFNVK